ncbi:DUF924 domain-containing protein [Pseudomonas sp. LS44]|uniref:DUF924 family protein n=1 Tax=Pseudomonas sp. LS44 TaxID=1357074 RepID=UPI00215A7EDA|nr:DUF924 family protein [Pseudomonas sp. LS44]UVE18221.1 DUF924 domain-containing protein [Pseudomonas sp. LS44]
MSAWQPLLEWWFGAPGVGATPSDLEAAAQRYGLWFGKQDSQDMQARERFAGQVEQALAGELSEWTAEPEGWLALILLLDQLPRMIYRDTPRAFAGDSRAQALVCQGLAEGREAALTPLRQVFIYLVLEHSENLAVQEQAVARFQILHGAAPLAERALFGGFLDYAEQHRRVIARFGRFPHRNAILQRPSTDAELSFLQEPGSRF